MAQDIRIEKFNSDDVIVHVLYQNSINNRYMEINDNYKIIIEEIKTDNKLISCF